MRNKVEYTTVKADFDNGSGNIKSVETSDKRTSIEIADIDSGHDYFFRVRAVNSHGESEPSAVVTIPIGSPPGAPTTWSSSNSAFVGETMELNWVHNPTDNSKQSHAELSIKIAKDMHTGAISFYDMPGYKVDAGIIIMVMR